MDSYKAMDSTPIQLSLYSLPTKPPDPPGLLTPPLHSLVSIPFQWEVAPGKPRPTAAVTPPSKSKIARCLDLPPRLASTESIRMTSTPSPTTVLDGPNTGPFISTTMSFRSVEGIGGSRERMRFSSWRWGGDISGSVRGNSDFSSASSVSDIPKVKNTRVRRKSSLLRLSHNTILGNIYESFKKVVPWKRKQVKPRNMSF